jgi:hypothetical protein
MSMKFQIVLPESLLTSLRREAERSGISVAELIRQSVTDRLYRKPGPPSYDPFEDIDGLANSGESTLAASVDEILYR